MITPHYAMLRYVIFTRALYYAAAEKMPAIRQSFAMRQKRHTFISFDSLFYADIMPNMLTRAMRT